MATRHENAVKLETTVNGLLQHDALGQAQRVFDRDWQEAMLANLPLRHPFVLDRPDRDGINALLDLAEEGTTFELQLLRGVDRRRKSAVAVGLVGHDQVIGWLPEEALVLLDEAGEWAEIYEPKLLAVRGLQAAQVTLEMELARPDLRQCSACQTLHTGEHENCADCRAKRKRKKKSLEETAETPAVPVAQAFHNIAEAAHQKKTGG